MADDEIRCYAETASKRLEALVTVHRLSVRGDKGDDSRAEDHIGRFRIWASNIGVNAKGHASLDHRLRDSPEARDLTLELLQSLSDHTSRAIDTYAVDETQIGGELNIDDGCTEFQALTVNYHPSRSATMLPYLYAVLIEVGVSLLSTVSSSFHGTETESLIELMELEPMEKQLRDIEVAIDRLYRLSLAIRRPSLMARSPGALKFVMRDDDGNDNEAVFESYALQRVTRQFPDAPMFLLKRLAKAITERRRYFLYRSSHQTKLGADSFGGSMSSGDTSANVAQPDQSTVVPTRSIHTPLPLNRRLDYLRAAPSEISATSASGFQKSQFQQRQVIDTPTIISTTLHPGGDTYSSLPVPDAPDIRHGAKEFECPYCCLMLPIREGNLSKWRRHVMNDLEPYICVFENCSMQHMSLRDRPSWVSHMRKEHTMQWTCRNRGHAPFVAHSEDDYDAHMHNVHPNSFTQAQLPWLRRNAQSVAQTILSSCPMCSYVPTESELKKENQELHMVKDHARIQSNCLVKHLATHLESSALISLPWQDKFKQPEEPERTSSSQVERHSLKEETDATELSFRDEDDIDHRTEVAIAWAEESGTHLQSKDQAMVFEEDWDFVGRKEYFGRDRDPTLQTFLQKLYLDASPRAYNSIGPLLPAYLMPIHPSLDFFGRDLALNAIETALLSQASGNDGAGVTTLPKTFAVHAPGGMGKTQVCAQFVALHRQDFDAVFWVHADEYNKLSHDFRDIAIKLGLVGENSADARDLVFARDVAKRWLVNPVRNLDSAEMKDSPKASWLLVFDGVEDPSILDEFWPYNGPGSVLITSRSPFSWLASVRLEPFTRDEAVAFLVKLTGGEASKEEQMAVGKVSDHLGGLPLALAQMAGLIQHKNLSFTEFLESYNEQQELLQQPNNELVAHSSGYEHTLASVWAFDSLVYGEPMLNLISMLDADGIPETLFLGALHKPGQYNFPASLQAYKAAKRELVACSLISRHKAERTFSIHRLVQDVARARMSEEKFRHNFMSCVKLINRIWPFEDFTWRHNVAKWASCEPLFPHIVRLKSLFKQVVRKDELSYDDYQFAKLLTDAGWYHHERGRSSDAKLFNDLAESICEALRSRLIEQPDQVSNKSVTLKQLDLILAEIQHNRGCIATEVNEPHDALMYQKRFNELMVQELAHVRGGRDMRLAISWNELGNAHMLNKAWALGQACFEKSIDLMRQLDNFQEISISLPLANLGLAHWLQHRYDEAMKPLIQGLAVRRAVFGTEDRVSFTTGRYLHALGNVRASQGALEDSHNYHHNALLHYKSTLGNNHHRTADTLVKVAEHHLRKGQSEITLALIDHAMKIYSSSNPSHSSRATNKHPSIYKPERARASFHRSQALRSAGRIPEAERELEKCFTLYREVWSDQRKWPPQRNDSDPKDSVHCLADEPADTVPEAKVTSEGATGGVGGADTVAEASAAPPPSQPTFSKHARSALSTALAASTGALLSGTEIVSSPAQLLSSWDDEDLMVRTKPEVVFNPDADRGHTNRAEKTNKDDLVEEDLEDLIAFWSK